MIRVWWLTLHHRWMVRWPTMPRLAPAMWCPHRWLRLSRRCESRRCWHLLARFSTTTQVGTRRWPRSAPCRLVRLISWWDASRAGAASDRLHTLAKDAWQEAAPIRPRSWRIVAQPSVHTKRGEALLNKRLGITPPTAAVSPARGGFLAPCVLGPCRRARWRA
jgi:hypothetical protein